MSPEQKQSWCIVVAFAFALVVFLLLIPLIGTKIAFGALGLAGLGGLAPVIFGVKRKAGEVAVDERDKMIAQKATMGGAMLGLNTALLLCMILWSVYRAQGKDTISINMLPLIVFAEMMMFWLARAITILVLYGRERSDGQD